MKIYQKNICILFGLNSYIANKLINFLKKDNKNIIFLVSRNKSSKYNYNNLEILFKKINSSIKCKLIVFNFANNVNVIEYTKKLKTIKKQTFLYARKIVRFCNKIKIDQKHIFLSSDRIFGKNDKNIYFSTKPNPIDPYGSLKLEYENFLKKNLIQSNLIVVRSTNIYGPGQKSKQFIPNIVSQINSKIQKNIKVGNIKAYRDYLYIDDLCEALLKIKNKNTSKKFQIYHLSNKKVKLEKILIIINKYYTSNNLQIKFELHNSLKRNKKFELGKFKLLRYNTSEKLEWYPKTSIDKGIKKILNYELKKNRKSNTKRI